MREVNEIVICKDDYQTPEEYHEAIKTAIMLLLDANYIMTVRYDCKGAGIVVINYERDDRKYDGLYPRWLTLVEHDLIDAYRDGDAEENYGRS